MNRLTLFLSIFILSLCFLDFSEANCNNNKKRGILKGRNEECKCQLAYANFDEGPYRGYIVFAQDECGDTTITGFWNKGFYSNQNYTFSIVDDCGNEIHNLGSMGLQVNNDGSTDPIKHKFNFDLNCTNQGILKTKSAYYKKRNTCHNKNYNKRQTPGDGGAGMQVNGDPSASAPVYP